MYLCMYVCMYVSISKKMSTKPLQELQEAKLKARLDEQLPFAVKDFSLS